MIDITKLAACAKNLGIIPLPDYAGISCILPVQVPGTSLLRMMRTLKRPR